MQLTTAQRATLKTFIEGDATLGSQAIAQQFDQIATALNANASPAFIVWKKTKVSISDIGDNMVASELATRSTTDATRLQTLVAFSPNGIDPSIADRRTAFDDIFSGAGGALTRAKLLALWKRSISVLAKLFATGTGSDASPGALVVEGTISGQEVSDIINGIIR